jgi:NmrA-like family
LYPEDSLRISSVQRSGPAQVLTIGATGHFAGHVVPALVGKGLRVRALVHDPDKAAQPDVALDGMPDGPMRPGLAAMFAAYTAHGFHGGNNLVLTGILGRPPRTLDAFFAELAH